MSVYNVIIYLPMQIKVAAKVHDRLAVRKLNPLLMGLVLAYTATV